MNSAIDRMESLIEFSNIAINNLVGDLAKKGNIGVRDWKEIDCWEGLIENGVIYVRKVQLNIYSINQADVQWEINKGEPLSIICAFSDEYSYKYGNSGVLCERYTGLRVEIGKFDEIMQYCEPRKEGRGTEKSIRQELYKLVVKTLQKIERRGNKE